MQGHHRHRPSSRMLCILSRCTLVMMCLLTAVACPDKNTPLVPEAYYQRVETGVTSRVLGIRNPGDSLEEARQRLDTLLRQMRAEWHRVTPLNSVADILAVYRAQPQLVPLADAIAQTLAANQAQEPAGPQHSARQATAVKQGLAAAYQQITGEPLR